jgi:hypothetical protein
MVIGWSWPEPDTPFFHSKPAGSLMDRSQAFGEQLDSLLSISTEIASVRELPDVQDRALAYCLELTNSEFGFIGLLDESGENVLVTAIKGVEPTTRVSWSGTALCPCGRVCSGSSCSRIDRTFRMTSKRTR